ERPNQGPPFLLAPLLSRTVGRHRDQGLAHQKRGRRPKRKVRRNRKRRRPGRFWESNNSTRPHQPNTGEKNTNWIGNKHQNQTADGGIERFATLDLVHIGLSEANIAQPGLDHASFGARDRARVALYPNYLSRRTNQPGG